MMKQTAAMGDALLAQFTMYGHTCRQKSRDTKTVSRGFLHRDQIGKAHGRDCGSLLGGLDLGTDVYIGNTWILEEIPQPCCEPRR